MRQSVPRQPGHARRLVVGKDELISRSLAAALRAAACCLSLVVGSAAIPAQAWAGEKIALVIGNSDYRSVGRLPNPVNDAGDMAISLGRLGFNVTHLSDLDFNGFRRALIDFGNSARTADEAVIFYAGHGVEIDGKNWLIPVDAVIKSEVDVYAEAINLETLIDISIMPKVIGLVVLDACRNDPFDSVKAAAGRSVSLPPEPGIDRSATPRAEIVKQTSTSAPIVQAESAAHGLAPVEVNDNILVAFAAAAGTTANDGAGRHSPYSSSLLRHVEKPGLEINYLFRDVHDDVLTETKTQEPAVYGTLSRDEIYLGGNAYTSSANTESEAEKVSWTFIRSTNDVTTLRHFSEQFPNSGHLPEVNDRIAQLEGAEKFAWSIVAKENSITAYKAFLDLYPYSDHAEIARVTLATLEASPNSSQLTSGPVNLPKPPASSYELVPNSPEATTTNPDSIDKAWDVLRDSRDQKIRGRFAAKYPSLRQHRLPTTSDLSLRPVNPTEWMLRTAKDDDVNSCFGGDSKACVKAVEKYPDYVQLRFQLCRSSGSPLGCMDDAVEDARQRGYLVSAYTRSEIEKTRNLEYRRVAERVQETVSTVVSNVVGNVVSNVVSQTVSNSVNNAVSAAASAAASNAAARAGANVATPQMVILPPIKSATLSSPPVLAGTGRWDARLGVLKAAPVTPVIRPAVAPTPTIVQPAIRATAPAVTVTPPAIAGTAAGAAAGAAAARAAGGAASNAAGRAASTAAGNAASTAAGRAASSAAGNAASTAAGRAASSAAGNAASTAAGRAASSAASNAASRSASAAASTAASHAAGRAASNAASNAASKAASAAASRAASTAAANAASNIRIPSDIRLKQDVVPVAVTDDGIQLYRYRYIGDATVYVGVMAQDVIKQVPNAVSQADNGYLQVDYQLLGIEFLTYHDWLSRHSGGAIN